MSPRTRLGLGLALLVSIAALAPAARAEAQPGPVGLIGGIAAEGGGLVDRSQGLMGGASVHLGARFFGVEVYGLSQGFIGGLVAGPHSGTLQGVLWNSAMLGFGAAFFHLGVGPSLDFAWGCGDQSQGSLCFSGSPMFGIDGRVALVFGSISISLDVHPTFYREGTVTGLVGGIGWEF